MRIMQGRMIAQTSAAKCVTAEVTPVSPKQTEKCCALRPKKVQPDQVQPDKLHSGECAVQKVHCGRQEIFTKADPKVMTVRAGSDNLTIGELFQ